VGRQVGDRKRVTFAQTHKEANGFPGGPTMKVSLRPEAESKTGERCTCSRALAFSPVLTASLRSLHWAR
jgi:hypothetical protein